MDIKSFLGIAATMMMFSCNESAREKRDRKSTDSLIATLNREMQRKFSMKILELSASEKIDEVLCQGWTNEDDAEALKGMGDNSTDEIPCRSFYFSTDGSFIKNPRNAMDYGSWTYDEEQKTITLNYTVDRGKDIYKIAAVAPDELQLLNTGINTSTLLKFTAPALRFRSTEDDPYHISNNKWRIKPRQPETVAALHERLKGNIHFFILVYKAAIEVNEKTVYLWGLPSCFKWYSGGIYLADEDQLNPYWVNCFYNKEQAHATYRIAEKLMENKYQWPKGEKNWLKQNLSVLQQMYTRMDSLAAGSQ